MNRILLSKMPDVYIQYVNSFLLVLHKWIDIDNSQRQYRKSIGDDTSAKGTVVATIVQSQP